MKPRVPGAVQHEVLRGWTGTHVASREKAGPRICGAPLRTAPRPGNADAVTTSGTTVRM